MFETLNNLVIDRLNDYYNLESSSYYYVEQEGPLYTEFVGWNKINLTTDGSSVIRYFNLAAQSLEGQITISVYWSVERNSYSWSGTLAEFISLEVEQEFVNWIEATI